MPKVVGFTDPLEIDVNYLYPTVGIMFSGDIPIVYNINP